MVADEVEAALAGAEAEREELRSEFERLLGEK